MRDFGSEKGVGRAMGLLGTVSAVGTALGPSLGGLLLPLAGWRAIFLVQAPLGALALVLAVVVLPRAARARELAATRSGSVLDALLARRLAVNFLVAAVMMTTLVVGPFYLTHGLRLQATTVGLVMSIGPLVAIFSGAPAGRLVDAWGTRRAMAIGLAILAAGAVTLAVLPSLVGVGGYVFALIVLTPGYQLVQAANNTAVLADVAKDRRGVVSSLLALSRNVGLIAGASAMGWVFALGVGGDVASASSSAIASAMRVTFLVAASLIGLALWIARIGPALEQSQVTLG
jgi:predicted MFS family arabinose efflux permease